MTLSQFKADQKNGIDESKSRTRKRNQGVTGKTQRKEEEPYGRFSNRSQEIKQRSKNRNRNETYDGFG